MNEQVKIEELSFEEAMAKLQVIVEQLEKGTAPLEETLALYEEGSALMRRCNALLEQAKRRVEMVDGESIRPFFEE